MLTFTSLWNWVEGGQCYHWIMELGRQSEVSVINDNNMVFAQPQDIQKHYSNELSYLGGSKSL